MDMRLHKFDIYKGRIAPANCTAPNHIADELVKLNDIELRGHHLIIEEAAGKPKTLNSQYN